MAQFTQPVNREAQLKTILDGYEQTIQKQYWLSEACQKDAIQNSWDARLDKKHGNNWTFKLNLIKNNNQQIITFEDLGTTGLIGSIPVDKNDLTSILRKENPSEKLAYFLCQDWSKKEGTELGSRGRGKMVFVGVSIESRIFFESIRNDDEKYIFGSFSIDENKEVLLTVESGGAAERDRSKSLASSIPKLRAPGTRIIIPRPNEQVIDAIKNGEILQQIQETWWEILHKYDADISVGIDGNYTKVEKSPWLPVEASGIKEHLTYENIPIEGYSRIKRISFCLLKNKDVPSSYSKIFIQRGGMCIERRSVIELNSLISEGSVYGSVEFDDALDEEMKKLEGPEHYSFTWYKGVATKVNKVLKDKLLDFAQKFSIIETKSYSSKEQREAELDAQKDLNQAAAKLGMVGGRGLILKKRKKHNKEEEKIILSFPEFSTPYPTGRVDFNQEINGAFVVPKSEYSTPLNVLVRIWVFRENGPEISNLLFEKELLISKSCLEENIGWDRIVVDSRFEKGKYYLKAKMISLESKILDGEKTVQKAEILYHELRQPFWVEEDPEDKGFFVVQRNDIDSKKHYIWWEEREDACYLFWNGKHLKLKEIANDKIALKETIDKEGYTFLLTILYTSVVSGEIKTNPRIKKDVENLEKRSFEEKVRWLTELRSELLCS